MQDGPSLDWQAARGIYQLYACVFGKERSLESIAEHGGFRWDEVPVFLKRHREQVVLGHCNCDFGLPKTA